MPSSKLSFSPPFRVGLLIDTATTWGRGIITGIHQYSKSHGGWHLYLEPRGVEEPVVLPRGFQADGLIARVGNLALAKSLKHYGVPVVNVSAIQLPGVQFPCITNDIAAVGRMAADYFLERRFKHFAYLNFRGLEYVVRQCNAFIDRVRKAGFQCAVYTVEPDRNAQGPNWGIDLKKLSAWLIALPKPVAILTWNGGREVIQVCRDVGLRIPEEIALLNGSEETLTNELSPIPLSGVQAACEKIGYEAAALLQKLMRRKDHAPIRPRLIPPIRVITRQSTDTLAIADRHLIEALQFIRENLASSLPIGAIATRAGISRRMLERRFTEFVGCTPAAYITRLRIDHVKALLSDTCLSIAEVAEASGFGSPEYMTFQFRKNLGTTPLRYRRSTRAT